MGALLVKSDVGTINSEITVENGKDIIVIENLPEFLGSDFNTASKKFIQKFNKSLNEGFFQIQGIEPVAYISGEKGKEARIIPTEENELIIYLESDRSDVVSKLMDKEGELLVKKSSRGRVGGLGMLGSALAGLPQPRLVFTGIMLIIGLFIWRKYKSFNIEKEMGVSKGKASIIQALQTEMHRYRSSLIDSWKNISGNNLKYIQEVLTKNMEKNISDKVDDETFKLKEKKLLYDKRAQNFKDKEKKLKESLGEIGKLQQELKMLQTQLV